MGAAEFYCEAFGATASDAFKNAQKDARWALGNEGYTGSVAEKSTFKIVHPKRGESVEECVVRHENDATFDDKWGPAGCIKIREGSYAFFGVASS